MVSPVEERLLYTAYKRYRELRKLPWNHNTKINFLRFLTFGIDNNRKFKDKAGMLDILDELPPKAIKRLEWLNGPNAEILLKVWLAQHPGFQ